MATRRIGIVVNGATGRLAQLQHFHNALVPIIREGGLPLAGGDRLLPDLLLAGRDEARLKAVADSFGLEAWTTDVAASLADDTYQVYFDVAPTGGRADRLHQAIAAGRNIYTDKPLAGSFDEAMGIIRAAETAGIRHGIVCDKLFLPGLRKLKRLIDNDVFGRVLSIRIEFGWWVFDGETAPSQRASWNYQRARGGGLVLDMFPHWSYVLGHLFGHPTGIYCQTATFQPLRRDESGSRFNVDVEDTAYALIDLDNGAKVQLLTSWASRLRRDDILEIQVDGTNGSAVATVRDCWTQSIAETPSPFWAQLDLGRPRADHFSEWTPAPEPEDSTLSFRAGWELFLRHVADGTPFPFPLSEGARALQLIDCAYRSAREKRWIEIAALPS
ncbi:MAG: Gfo/Idh/MocA family protein [Hyphomicrobiaceae bacterium]